MRLDGLWACVVPCGSTVWREAASRHGGRGGRGGGAEAGVVLVVLVGPSRIDERGKVMHSRARRAGANRGFAVSEVAYYDTAGTVRYLKNV